MGLQTISWSYTINQCLHGTLLGLLLLHSKIVLWREGLCSILGPPLTPKLHAGRRHFKRKFRSALLERSWLSAFSGELSQPVQLHSQALLGTLLGHTLVHVYRYQRNFCIHPCPVRKSTCDGKHFLLPAVSYRNYFWKLRETRIINYQKEPHTVSHVFSTVYKYNTNNIS